MDLLLRSFPLFFQQILPVNELTASYKQRHVLADRYDAICIGSGLGSLTTASLLARTGKKVLVLERHYTPGGFTHVFTRNDYEWDVGLHYVGDVHKPGTLMHLLFEHVTDGNLHWADMGEVYDKVIFGDKEYDLVKGVSNFKQQLKSYFPAEEDARAIDQYVDLLFKASSAGRTFYAEKVMPPMLSWAAAPFLRSGLAKFYRKTTREVLESLTSNQELIGVLTAQYGDYGMPPGESSFSMHAVVAKHYLNGGAYPVGGSAEIFNTIAPAIINAGGQILTNAEVSQIVVENGKATGVKMKDGKILQADLIISGAGVDITFNKLLEPAVTENFGFFPELKKLQPSASHLCLYIGLKHTAEELLLRKSNYWIYPDEYDHDKTLHNFFKDPEKNPLPVAYISFPSVKDPTWEERYPGRSTVEIITVAPYDWFEKWEHTRWHKRGEEYEATKERWSQRLLEQLYKVEPQLRGKIDHYELSTPLSTRHFAGYQHGEIYGLNHSPFRFEQKFLRPHTPVKNLFLTGQDIVSCGIGGALIGGVLTASAILRQNILGQLMDKKKKTQRVDG
jgi:all-trans-retinol 13,14-reductase